MHSVDHPHPSRQRGPHNDASMLDGDSGHGNPGEPAGDEWAVDTDTDVVDQAAEDELDDAVADAAPETDDEEGDELEAEAGIITTSPKAFEEIEEEVDEPAEGESDEPADAEAGVDEEDEDEELDEDGEVEPEVAGETSVLEEELDRQMDRTSTDPEDPAHHPPPSHVAAPPIDGYDALTVPQVVEQANALDAGQLNAVLEYERANRNRKTLVAKLTKLTRTV
jgi:hypothetical protein